MKISIVLMLSEKPVANGYPLKVQVSHKGKPQRRGFAHAWPEHWSDAAAMITDGHPDYETLAPIIMSHKLRARKLELTESDAAVAMRKMFEEKADDVKLAAFGADWINERRELAAAHDKKGDEKARNRALGYADTMENALAQFLLYAPAAGYRTLDKALLTGFKRSQQMKGNSPATIHLYLRSVRTLYNGLCEKHGFEKLKPFEGVFAGLSVKGSRGKKKWLDMDAMRLLERLELSGGVEVARDMWLLQFYFGGADLIDIYYIKKIHIRKGRVRFDRGKIEGGQVIDLAIHPKAQLLLDKYAGPDEWQFPWRKDLAGYENFLRRVQKNLVKLQTAQNDKAEAARLAAKMKAGSKKIDEAPFDAMRIDVLPELSNLAPKVARHTFGNRGRVLQIDGDMLGALMGHERGDVDTWYKDKFPDKMRDAALFEIIGD